MKSVKLVFLSRVDSASKPGGDLVQISAYVRALTEDGIEAEVRPWTPEFHPVAGELYGLVNVDRPYEMVLAAQRLSRRPFFVIPIHHGDEAIRALRSDESSVSLKRRVVNILPWILRELMTFALRVRGTTAPSRMKLKSVLEAASTSARLRSRISKLLQDSAFVVYLSSIERASLESDYAAFPEKWVIAPNGVDDVGEGVRWEARSTDVLVVGRIEPRKRQLQLLRAAEAAQIALTFVGKIDQNSGAYGRVFAEEIRLSRFSRWLGAKTHVETMQLMQQHRVLANASWAEVQSLVEIEAAMAGCRVVTLESGSTREFIPSAKVLPLGSSLHSLVSVARAATSEATPPPLFAYPHTWVTSSRRISQMASDIPQ